MKAFTVLHRTAHLHSLITLPRGQMQKASLDRALQISLSLLNQTFQSMKCCLAMFGGWGFNSILNQFHPELPNLIGCLATMSDTLIFPGNPGNPRNHIRYIWKCTVEKSKTNWLATMSDTLIFPLATTSDTVIWNLSRCQELFSFNFNFFNFSYFNFLTFNFLTFNFLSFNFLSFLFYLLTYYLSTF